MSKQPSSVIQAEAEQLLTCAQVNISFTYLMYKLVERDKQTSVPSDVVPEASAKVKPSVNQYSHQSVYLTVVYLNAAVQTTLPLQLLCKGN